MDRVHLRDERIALRHVANQRFDLLGIVRDVVAEDLCGAAGGLMKSEQRVNQRGLAGSVGTEQTDSFTTQIAAQVFQNLPAAERYAETVQVDNRRLRGSQLSFDRFFRNRSGECHTLLIAPCPDNSK